MKLNPFKPSATTRGDVIFALASAVVAVWKTVDTAKKYKADQATINHQEKK
jgi:hypothetical protein